MDERTQKIPEFSDEISSFDSLSISWNFRNQQKFLDCRDVSETKYVADMRQKKGKVWYEYSRHITSGFGGRVLTWATASLLYLMVAVTLGLFDKEIPDRIAKVAFYGMILTFFPLFIMGCTYLLIFGNKVT